MTSALIGYTGFVGQNLLSTYKFDFTYNSRNIQNIKNKEFDILFCAGLPGTKWIANKDPESDLLSIDKLKNLLMSVKAKKVVLISTVDVFSNKAIASGVDESCVPHEVNLHPYGKHRLFFEYFIENNFSNFNIVRLPALFGSGLKKNAIYDLIHGHEVYKLNPCARFQFYDLNNLKKDLSIIIDHGIERTHLVSEPIFLKDLAYAVFPNAFKSLPPIASTESAPFYNVKTQYDFLWKRQDGHIQDKEDIIRKLKHFILKESKGLYEADRVSSL